MLHLSSIGRLLKSKSLAVRLRASLFASALRDLAIFVSKDRAHSRLRSTRSVGVPTFRAGILVLVVVDGEEKAVILLLSRGT